jgi:hypothetical protein
MWVSTAMVGSPKAMLSTTLAVLRPTPGRASSASRSLRHLAAVALEQQAREPARRSLPWCGRGRWSGCSRRCPLRRARPWPAGGMGAEQGRVARLTPLSVAWAESTTATSSWKGVAYSSSPFGSGLASAGGRRTRGPFSGSCGVAGRGRRVGRAGAFRAGAVGAGGLRASCGRRSASRGRRRRPAAGWRSGSRGSLGNTWIPLGQRREDHFDA